MGSFVGAVCVFTLGGALAIIGDIAPASAGVTQIITFTLPSAPIAGTSAVISANGGGSPNPVTFSIDSLTTTNACTVTGTTVTFSGLGRCAIDANQAGNSNYSAAAQVEIQTVDHLGDGTLVIDDQSSGEYILPSGGTLSATIPGFGHGVAVDQRGDLFGTEQNSNLYSWSAGAASSTIKASGFSAAVGVATDNAGDVIVADYGTGRLYKLPFGGGDVLLAHGLSTSVRFSAITKDGGTVYVSDQGNNQVLSLPFAGGSSTTVSTGNYSLSSPGGLAIDGAGDLFISDTNNNRIIEVPGDDSAPSILSTGSVTLNRPLGLATDAAGNLYEADSGSGHVYKIPAGGGTPTSAYSGGAVYGVAVVSAPPTFNTDTPPATLNRGVSYSYTFSATSANGARLHYQIGSGSLPSGLTLNSTTGVISGTPTASGSYQIAVTAFDGANFLASPTTTLTVTGRSQQPVFSSSAPSGPSVGSTYRPTVIGDGSQSPVVLSIDDSSASTCSLNNATVTFNHPGACQINANQQGDAVYSSAATVTQTINVVKASPEITWADPAPITPGIQLGAKQLNATATSAGVRVLGTYAFSPPAGTVLKAGSQTLSVTFTPNNSTDYKSVAASVMISVGQSSNTMTFTAVPTNPVYGSTYTPNANPATGTTTSPVFSIDASSGQGVCSIAHGVVSFLGAGTCIVDASVAGGSGSGVNSTQQTITVNKAPLTVTASVATMTYASMAPSITPTYSGFVRNDSSASLASPPTCWATATPTTSVGNYQTYCAGASSNSYQIDYLPGALTIVKASPVLNWQPPATMTSGTSLSSSELDATANVPGTFTYTPAAGATQPEGTSRLSVNFEPTDSTDYQSVSKTVSLNVGAAPTTTIPPLSTPNGQLAVNINGAPGQFISATSVTVQGQGFRPGSLVTVFAHSTPVELGTLKVSRSGDFSAALALPPQMQNGAHHIIVHATLASGKTVTQLDAFTVVSGDRLGSIGSIPSGPLSKYVTFVPTSHPATVLTTTAGTVAVVGAVGAALGGAGGGAGAGSGGGGYLEDVELEREEQEHEGDDSKHGPRGDRSHTWRWPFTHHVDRLSASLPSRLAAFSPVIGRVAVDGDYLRAIFGAGWILMCLLAVALGAFAASTTSWYAIPPALPLFLVVLGLGVLDSTLGYLSGFAFVISAAAAGHMFSATEIRTGAGIVLVWFAVPLAAASLRPLRRKVTKDFESLWERVSDIVIGGLFAAWAAQKMVGAISGLAGVELPIESHVTAIGYFVIGFVALRVAIETIAVHQYPRRLRAVHYQGGLESENLQVGISLIIQIALFLFISIVYMGSTWALYVGAAVFFAPLIPWLFADHLPKSAFVAKWKPRGLMNWFLIIVTGVLLSKLLIHLIHDDKLLEAIGFIILPLPVLISWALELFEKEEEEEEEEEEEAHSIEHGEKPLGEAIDEHLHLPLGLEPLSGAFAFAGGGTEPFTIQMHESTESQHSWLHTGARSEFREQEASRRDEHDRDARAMESLRTIWLKRCGGLGLVIVATYLVVTHIAGG